MCYGNVFSLNTFNKTFNLSTEYFGFKIVYLWLLPNIKIPPNETTRHEDDVINTAHAYYMAGLKKHFLFLSRRFLTGTFEKHSVHIPLSSIREQFQKVRKALSKDTKTKQDRTG